MALPVTYWLEDVNGALCVAARQTDWNEPRYVVNFWPTKLRTWDFCRFFEVAADAIRPAFTVKQSMPGEYVITHVHGQAVFGNVNRLELVKGSHTHSIHTRHEPVPVPRVGKGTKLEWRDGRWYKCTPKGGWVAIVV